MHQDNWTQEVTHSLKKFEKQLIIALKEKGWDGKEDEATVTWTFAGALFYCITVITTIGMVNNCDSYSTFNLNLRQVTGTLPPRRRWGRL